MSHEFNLMVLMLAPVVSMLGVYYSLQLVKNIGGWFNL
jgi:hypothetical protein